MSALATDTVGRVPPHDLEAEAAVLSAVLLTPDALEIVREISPAPTFYARANGLILEAATALADGGQPVDVVTVAGWLRSRGRLADVGGMPYLTNVVDAAPAVANIESYAQVVREKWRVRRIIGECQRIAAEGYGDIGDTQSFLDAAERTVFEIAEAPASRQDTCSALGEAVTDFVREMRDRATGLSRAVLWGIPPLDALTQGARRGSLVIVGARPGMGKSSFCGGVLVNVARQETPDEVCASLMFSAEMPRTEIAARALSAEARVDGMRIRDGQIPDEDEASRAGKQTPWNRITQAGSALYNLPAFIDDRSSVTVAQIRARVRRIKAELAKWQHAEGKPFRLRLVVVDYLQIMGSLRERGKTRDRELGEITSDLKGLAKDEDLCVVVLSQLNRGVEARPNKRPLLSDLRESGSIEQDADLVMFLYRDEYYNRASKFTGIAEILIAKQRGGSLGRAFVGFDKAFTLFRDLTPSEAALLEREHDEERNAPTRQAPQLDRHTGKRTA